MSGWEGYLELKQSHEYVIQEVRLIYEGQVPAIKTAMDQYYW